MISTSPWLRAGALNSTELAPIVGWPEQEGSVRMVVVVVEAVEQVSSCIRKSYIPGAQPWQQVSGLVSSGGTGIIMIVVVVVIKKYLVSACYVLHPAQGTEK